MSTVQSSAGRVRVKNDTLLTAKPEMTYAYFTNSTTDNAFRVQQAAKFQKPRQYSPDSNWYGQPWSAFQGFLISCWQLSLRFGKHTTIHGLDRLLAARASRWERFVWLCTFIVALMGATYVCLKLSRRYNEGHFQTVVESTRFHVYHVPFPVVTICNANRLNWKRIDQAKKFFLPGENSTEKLALFERIVATYDDVSFGHFQPFAALKYEPVAELDQINFTTVAEFMTWRCEEMLTNCVWRHSNYNCCDIFSHRRSKQGLCLAFNTLETVEGRRMKLLDPLWPWHTGSAGPTSALNVRVLINPEQHIPNRTNEKGINVMITEPYVWHKDPFAVPAYTQTLVEIDPVIYFYDNDTRSLSSDQRQCVFNDEQNSRDFKSLHGYIYMIENCMSECHQEYLVRYCNCTMDLFFPPGQHRPCRAKDLPCLAQNNDFFLYSYQPGEEDFVRSNYEGMICKCFRNCYSLNYITDVRPTFLPPEVYGNLSYVDLDVHYRFETMMVYRTSLVFGWVDLMVSFGGIAGLFLGCSLISGIELAYFICIEVPANIFNGLRQKCQQRGIHSTDQATPNWSRTRFNIQNQLENHMLKIPTMTLDKQPLNNWQRLAWANNKHVISK